MIKIDGRTINYQYHQEETISQIIQIKGPYWYKCENKALNDPKACHYKNKIIEIVRMQKGGMK